MTQTRSGKAATAGDKHALDDRPASPPAKAPKKEKQQQTIEQSLNVDAGEDNKQAPGDSPPEKKESSDAKPESKQEPQASQKGGDGQDGQNDEEQNGDREHKSANKEEDGAVEPHGRHGAVPSNILEKGIIYFFFRGRVGIDKPEQVDDVARTHIVLRPIPTDAKLGQGPIGDSGTSRLIAIPKKTFPQSGRERWIAIVEKDNASFAKLKDEFLASNDYETKTAGTRHTPAATPIGEGVYAITCTGRENHLAYMLTLPEKLGEVQTDIGLKQKGSWIISTRNPQYPAPKNVALPESPDFSKEASLTLDEFRSLRWMGTLPKHLVPNAQFLLVGESSGIDKAMEPDKQDAKETDKEDPMEEMEKMEHEDTRRMEHLGKDASDAIFSDLEAHAKDYPKLQTTF